MRGPSLPFASDEWIIAGMRFMSTDESVLFAYGRCSSYCHSHEPRRLLRRIVTFAIRAPRERRFKSVPSWLMEVPYSTQCVERRASRARRVTLVVHVPRLRAARFALLWHCAFLIALVAIFMHSNTIPILFLC